MKGGDIAGLLIRQARARAGLESGGAVPGYLRALVSIQDRTGQGSAFSGGDGASAAPVGPGLDAGTRESGTMLEGPALRQPRLRLLL